MIRFASGTLVFVAAVVAVVACADRDRPTGPDNPNQLTRMETMDAHTMGSGTVSKLLGRATYGGGASDDGTLKVKRTDGGDWHMEIKAKPGFDLAVQSITFEVNGQSGWHRHPGPVLITVVKGEMTFYESGDPTCTPIRRRAGESYLDTGDEAHIARNESGAPAENIVAYFVPPGARDLKFDADRPGNCPF